MPSEQTSAKHIPLWAHITISHLRQSSFSRIYFCHCLINSDEIFVSKRINSEVPIDQKWSKNASFN